MKLRKLKNYTGVLILLILCVAVFVLSVFIYSPFTNLGRVPVLSSTKMALYNRHFDHLRLLTIMPDKFAFPSEIGFSPPKPLALLGEGNKIEKGNPSVMFFEPYKVFLDKAEITWPDPKVAYTTIKNVFFADNVFKYDKPTFSSFHGVSVTLDKELEENNFLVPNIPFELFPTNLLSCRIKAFVRIKNGCVSDVFIEESDAPYEINNHVLQRIYRSTVKMVPKEIYGNVIVAWKK